MNTVELQNTIIRKILKTNNVELLDYFHSILSAENQTSYKLSKFEKQVINESLAEYKNGIIISNDDIFAKTEEWLQK